MYNKNLAIGLLAVAAIVLGSQTYFNQVSENSPKPKEYVVELKDSGFEPKNLLINQGDSVKFTTSRNKEFWPASDLHPSHEIYPEFDPQKPISANDSWIFKFTIPGEWHYHDHLASLYIGSITVSSGSSNQLAPLSSEKIEATSCFALARIGDKKTCWKKSLEQAMNEKGIKAGFDLYVDFYNSEPIFAQDCHGFTHQIGEKAYKAYSQKGDFEATAQVAYCSYGFFHGFIEAMFQNEGTLDRARVFCDYIDDKLKGQTSTLNACLHGIGHGVTDGTDKKTWGNVRAMIEPGKKLCEKIGKIDFEKYLCATGVFNSLEAFYQEPKYNLGFNKKDPFWICRQQETSYFKQACFDDFKDIIMAISDNDFEVAAKFVEGISENEYAVPAIDNLATYAGYFILRKPSFDYAINICHNLQPRLHVSCISGLGAGFMTAGAPDKEYVKAIELCQSPLLTKAERSGCFNRVLHASQARYSSSIHRLACDLVSKDDLKGIDSCK